MLLALSVPQGKTGKQSDSWVPEAFTVLGTKKQLISLKV
jgi:hypothetical protein